MAGNLFFGMFRTSTSYCHFNFLMSLFVLSGCIPSSALDTVLLVARGHLKFFLTADICTASNCFTSFAFPSHASPAYCSFGTECAGGAVYDHGTRATIYIER